MKIALYVCAAMISACLVGCESMQRGLAQRLSHVGGAITQHDLSKESFQRHMSSSVSEHILVIRCSLSRQSSKNSGRKAAVYDAQGSMKTAFALLENALLLPFVKLGRRATMAVLVFPPNHAARQVYALPEKAGASIYVASSDIVEGGSILHDAMSTNILRLADRTDDAFFPCENSIKPHLMSTQTHILDEFIDFDFQLHEGYKGVAMSPKEIGELNECTRSNYLHDVSVAWPSLLSDADGAPDICYISWDSWVGLVSGTPLAGSFEIALVSAKDSALYYFKKHIVQFGVMLKSYDTLTEPTECLRLELERIKELRSQTSRPSP